MSAIQKLRPETEEGPAPDAAAALGFSLQIAAGDGRAIVLQTHLPNDIELPALKGMLGKMADAGDWLKARYDLDAARRERDTHKKTYAQMVEDEQRCGTAWEAETKRLGAELAALQQGYDTAFETAYERSAATGRRADRAKFQAPAEVRQRATVVAQKTDEIEKRRIDHAAELANYATNLKRWTEILAQDDAEIARLEAILNG